MTGSLADITNMLLRLQIILYSESETFYELRILIVMSFTTILISFTDFLYPFMNPQDMASHMTYQTNVFPLLVLSFCKLEVPNCLFAKGKKYLRYKLVF